MSNITKDFSDGEFAASQVLNDLAAVCYGASLDKGFWKDALEIEHVLLASMSESPAKDRLLKALQKMVDSQKVALMHSELGEATEAQRKDLPSDKLTGFTGEEEEYADTIIRILDHAGKKRLRIGEAVVLKMRYNVGREFMHGKKF